MLVFLCYFLVITNFLYSQTPLLALYMFATAIVITATLSVVTLAGRRLPVRGQLRDAAVLLAQALGSLFVIVKFAGAAYLIWLGIRLWQSAPLTVDMEADAGDGKAWRSLLTGLAISLGNPKVIAFYLGFLPAFLEAPHGLAALIMHWVPFTAPLAIVLRMAPRMTFL